ncbi:MAG TPA: TonB family protein, partial [Thermoanaerobaculia bacterium]
MFETSVASARVASKGRRAGLLTASSVFHTAAIFGIVAVSVASVNFPANAPDEYSLPLIAHVDVPPPLGNPNGGGKPAQPPAEKPKDPPPQPNQITAPTAVPDEVVPAESQSTSNNTTAGESTGSEGDGLVPGPVGVPWGDPNSVSNDLNLPPAIVDTPPVEDRIYQSHEVKAPVIIKRVEPRFPQTMIRTGMSGVVIVRCIIDKNGNVRDPEVIRSAMPPFDAAVIDAVQQWKFTPGSLRGEAVNCYLNLT